MSIFVLPHDAWAAIGVYMSPASLSNVSATCQHVHDRVWCNQALWNLQSANRWRSLSQWGIVDDAKGLYRAGHLAACRLSTNEPWSTSIPRPAEESPYTAHLLIKHSSSGYLAPPSTIPAISTVSRRAAPFSKPPDVVSAALDKRVHFWVWGSCSDGSMSASDPAASTSDAAADGSSDLSHALHNPAGFSRGVSGGARHYCSHPQYSHGGSIDALIEVPTNGVIGVATGARDHTIKLWAPFQDNSSAHSASSEVGLVRPIKTLRGHTGAVTALATIRNAGCGSGADAAGDNASTGSSDSSRDTGSGLSVLASASADRTIKLWDLSSLQQLPVATGNSNSGGGSASRLRSAKFDGASGSAIGRQQGYRSLLGTLRGHSDAVTALLRWDEGSDSGEDSSMGPSSGSSLLSGGKDSRLKLWNVEQGRNACVATWRLPQQVSKVLDWLYLKGCVTILMHDRLQVIDVRVPGSSGSVTQGVVSMEWPECHLAAAMAHGSIIAAGGCKGVRAWDVRMTSSNKGASTELFSSRMPNGEPVSLVHVDRVELVAATNTSALHSPASIAVWSLPCGQRVQLLSSTLSAATLHGKRKLMSREELSVARETAWQLMDSMRDSDANQVLALLHQQHLVQQQQQQQQQQEMQAGAAVVAQLLQAQPLQPLLQQQQEQDAAEVDEIGTEAEGLGGDEGDEGDGVLSESLNDWLDDIRDDTELGADDSDDGENVFKSGASSSSEAGGASSSVGRIEPGVIAMAVQGGMIACVDTLGNVLIRDFASGTPKPEHIQNYIAAGPESEAASRFTHSRAAAAAAEGGSSDDSKAAAGAGTDEQQQGQQQQDQQQQERGRSEIPSSKFWRV